MPFSWFLPFWGGAYKFVRGQGGGPRCEFQAPGAGYRRGTKETSHTPGDLASFRRLLKRMSIERPKVVITIIFKRKSNFDIFGDILTLRFAAKRRVDS